MKQVVICCDGACKGNPGLGGWGAIITYKEYKKRIYGFEKDTTNNRMELLAAIRALESLTESCSVRLLSDSQYVIKGMSQWIINWRKKGWHNVKNVDLWQKLEFESQKHHVTWTWVKGHSGHPGNNEADRLANLAVSTLTTKT